LTENNNTGSTRMSIVNTNKLFPNGRPTHLRNNKSIHVTSNGNPSNAE